MTASPVGAKLPFDTIDARYRNQCDTCDFKGLLHIVDTQSVICSNCLLDMAADTRARLIERAIRVRPVLTVAKMGA